MTKANVLLQTINENGGLRKYQSNTKVRQALKAAFELYRKSHPRYSGRLGCEACRNQIFKWLQNA